MVIALGVGRKGGSQSEHYLFHAEVEFSVVFQPGQLNTNADVLSWLPQPETDSEPEELLMQLGNPQRNEHLVRSGVNLLWGENWWEEIEHAQTETDCPVMLWLDYTVEEMLKGRAAPQPDPNENETSWWHCLLMELEIN